MVQFLDPETTEILPFLDPEIVKMDQKNSGSRNHRNGVISGSRNRRKGRQILYGLNCFWAATGNNGFCRCCGIGGVEQVPSAHLGSVQALRQLVVPIFGPSPHVITGLDPSLPPNLLTYYLKVGDWTLDKYEIY